MKVNSPIKILLVDDLPENLFALELILADKNYSFVRANSGNEALKILLHEQDFAIILMDVQMPEMDGFETVELIREIETLNHVPIIFLTASMDNAKHVFKGYQAGAVDYMIKPLVPEILTAKVAVFVELYQKTHQLVAQNEEKEKRAYELVIANKELLFQDQEKGKRAAELVIANKELIFQNDEKEKRADELIIANKELVFQDQEKGKRADELVIANKELVFQNEEKGKRAAELVIANKELVFQNEEKEKRADELIIANKELVFQNQEKEKRADELIIANIELAFQNGEKIKRADELIVVNTELAFQNDEKEKRADELIIANKELIFQNEEKEKRADELILVNKELAFQNEEKEKRAAELVIADIELDFQNEEKQKQKIANIELKAFNNSLKRTSHYARSLIEASLDPFVTISAEGKITDVNEASAKVTGETRDKLIGADFSDYFTEPEKAREGYKQVFDKSFVSDYPLTIQHKNGKLTDVLYNASVYKDEEGNVLGVFAAARDVTAQKAEELSIANKELILQNKEKENQAAILEIANKELKFQNDEKEKRAAELIIANKELVFQNEEKEKRAAELIIANLELVFQNGEKIKRAAELIIVNTELAFQNEEKEKRANELIIANKELAFQNEEKEKRANELIITNKELESFNYISSHDLQEPLRKIQIFSTRLIADESKNLSDKGKEYVLRIEDAAKRMRTLIDDLLAYSRTTSSERKFKTTSLAPIIEAVKNDFEEIITAKQAIIEVGEMCDAHIIPFQFHQLIHNLIGNALKFSNPDRPPHITINSRNIKGNKVKNQKLLSEKEYCHITVTDNGIGFAPQYKDHIFEIFKRLHDKEKISGTGIGLTIVKKIVENHNGVIIATGESNKGASFDIYIPSNSQSDYELQ